jgi:hypothetical protein
MQDRRFLPETTYKEINMLLHLPIAILATLSPIAVSDTVPKFDTVRECRIEGGPSVDVARCSREEAAALRQLQDAWTQYAGADRKACTAEGTIDDFASYVELLSCLEMTRDARSAENNTHGPRANRSCANPSQNGREIMTSVHDVTYDLLRRHGVTKVFGNPASNAARD